MDGESIAAGAVDVKLFPEQATTGTLRNHRHRSGGSQGYNPEPPPAWMGHELLRQLEELDNRVTRLERAFRAEFPHHPHAPLLIVLQILGGIA